MKSVEKALESYRLNHTMREFFANECKTYGLFDENNEPILNMLDHAPPVVQLWYDRYTRLDEHIKYIDTAYSILAAAYGTENNAPHERAMCEVIFRKYLAPQKRTSLQIIDDLRSSGFCLSSSSFYRALHKGLDLLSSILVDPDPAWNRPVNNAANE